jgi:hypothetical protein
MVGEEMVRKMRPRERAIAERFLAKHMLDGKFSFYYHLPVAEYPPVAGLLPEERRMVQALRELKIDILVETTYVDYIIEVKPQTDTRMLGQLETYRNIYTTKVKPGRKVELWAVVEAEDPSLKAIFAEHGIKVVVV